MSECPKTYAQESPDTHIKTKHCKRRRRLRATKCVHDVHAEERPHTHVLPSTPRRRRHCVRRMRQDVHAEGYLDTMPALRDAAVVCVRRMRHRLRSTLKHSATPPSFACNERQDGYDTHRALRDSAVGVRRMRKDVQGMHEHPPSFPCVQCGKTFTEKIKGHLAFIHDVAWCGTTATPTHGDASCVSRGTSSATTRAS